MSRLRALGTPDTTSRQTRLAQGNLSIQCIDPSLGEGFSGVLRGAEFGAPAGAILGLGIAVSVSGTGPDVFAGLDGSPLFWAPSWAAWLVPLSVLTTTTIEL